MLRRRRGGVVDDLIVYLHGPDDVLLVPNAANAAEVLRPAGRRRRRTGVTVTDRHAEVAVLAVQGPRSLQVLELLGLPGELAYMSFVTGTGAHGGAEVTVCRTGYTGEHGYELLVDADRAAELWDAVLEAGQDLGIRPCGLGARDTLRTEMGYPLHGHELSPRHHARTRPAPAGPSAGRSRRSGAARRCSPRRRPARPGCCGGCASTGRGIPRPGMAVLDAAGARVGEVTSGTFSPTLRTGIALALLDTAAGVGEGDELAVDVRGRPQAVRGRQAAVRRVARALSVQLGFCGSGRCRPSSARVTRAACRPSSRPGRPSAAARPSWCRARSGARPRS